MTAAHVDTLIEGHLLGALEAAERDEITRHLRGCEACSTKVRESREVLAVLPQSLEPLAPRESVKVGLLAAIETEADDRLPRPISEGSRARSRHSSGGTPLFALAAAVFAAVAAGALAWALILQNRLDERDQQLASARLAAEGFARSAETLHMESEFAGGPVEAAIAVPRQGTEITVVVTGLPALPAGEQYRLWLFAEGQPQAGVPLTVDGDGNIVAQLDVDLSQFDAMELDAQSVDATGPGGQLVIGGPLR